MKLHKEIVAEHQGPISYRLILNNIVKNGDVTDNYQLYVLALLSEFFKDGLKSIDRELSDIPFSASNATRTDVIDSIKTLSATDKVALAQNLLDSITAGEMLYSSKLAEPTDFIKTVLRVQR